MFKLDSIPDAISREAYMEVIRLLGLDPHDLRSLEFRMDGIYAEVRATSEDGRPVLDLMANESVVHRVFIPVKDGLEGDPR